MSKVQTLREWVLEQYPEREWQSTLFWLDVASRAVLNIANRGEEFLTGIVLPPGIEMVRVPPSVTGLYDDVWYVGEDPPGRLDFPELRISELKRRVAAVHQEIDGCRRYLGLTNPRRGER